MAPGLVVLTLSNEILFKFLKKFQVEKIIWCQSFFPNNCLHGLDIFTDSIVGILQESHSLNLNNAHYVPIDLKHLHDLCESCFPQWQTSSILRVKEAH